MIKTLNNQGAFIKDIAAELGVHPRTVSRALARGGAPQPQRQKRGSKLDPYKPKIDKLLSENVWNAMVILREIQADGYTGEETLVGTTLLPNEPCSLAGLRSGSRPSLGSSCKAIGVK